MSTAFTVSLGRYRERRGGRDWRAARFSDMDIVNEASRLVVVSPVLEPTDDNPSGIYGQIRGGGTCIPGDWVLVGENSVSVIKPDVFEQCYEPVPVASTPDELGDAADMAEVDEGASAAKLGVEVEVLRSPDDAALHAERANNDARAAAVPRRGPPTADEVRELEWWWNFPIHGQPHVLQLNVTTDGTIVYCDPGSAVFEPDDWSGEWAPCLPPSAAVTDDERQRTADAVRNALAEVDRVVDNLGRIESALEKLTDERDRAQRKHQRALATIRRLKIKARPAVDQRRPIGVLLGKRKAMRSSNVISIGQTWREAAAHRRTVTIIGAPVSGVEYRFDASGARRRARFETFRRRFEWVSNASRKTGAR